MVERRCEKLVLNLSAFGCGLGERWCREHTRLTGESNEVRRRCQWNGSLVRFWVSDFYELGFRWWDNWRYKYSRAACNWLGRNWVRTLNRIKMNLKYLWILIFQIVLVQSLIVHVQRTQTITVTRTRHHRAHTTTATKYLYQYYTETVTLPMVTVTVYVD